MDANSVLSLILVAGGLAFLMWFLTRTSPIDKYLKSIPGLLRTVDAGQYVTGLPGLASVNGNLLCAITAAELQFLSSKPFGLAGRIPAESIQRVAVEDKSQVLQRLTLTRIALLGPLAWSRPKATKYREFCLLIDWTGANGEQQSTVFEFSGSNCQVNANSAANAMSVVVKHKGTGTAANEPPAIAGVSAPAITYCSACGTKLQGESRFCIGCGKPTIRGNAQNG